MNQNEIDDASERMQNLIVNMIMVMEKYQDASGKITGNVQRELDKSLGQQRKMIVEMVRNDLLSGATGQVQGYVDDMEKARDQMVEQVREFNTYLYNVKKENRKIFRMTVLGSAVTLAALVVGGIALVFFYGSIISQKKLEADMLGRINRADIVQCGEGLCAKTGKAGSNGYRAIRQRSVAP